MMEVRPFLHRLELPVLDVQAENVGKFRHVKRTVFNCPLSFFYPHATPVVLRWHYAKTMVAKKLAAQRVAQAKREQNVTLDEEKEFDKIFDDMLSSPVNWNNQLWHGLWGWGSNIKDAQTYGLEEDYLVDMGLATEAEHYSRFTRAMVCNCRMGAMIGKKANIKFVQDGEEYMGVVYHDGMSGIRKRTSRIFYTGKKKTRLDQGRQNWQIWQRFPYDAIKSEAEPVIEKYLNWIVRDMSWPRIILYDYANRDEFFEADPEMRHHPLMKDTLARGVGTLIQELATTVPCPTKVKLVIPSWTDTIITDPGDKLLVRWPVDSPSNIRAVHVDEDPANLAIVNAIEAAQYTFVFPGFFAKGIMRQLEDDQIEEQYDLVLCVEDIKMMQPGWNGIKNLDMLRQQPGVYLEEEFFLGYQQWWGRGSCMAIPHWIDRQTLDMDYGSHLNDTPVDPAKSWIVWHWNGTVWVEREYVWKSFGGDFDGDFASVLDMSERPVIFAEAKKFQIMPSFKIKKSHKPLSENLRMARQSIDNQVGLATVVVGTTFGSGSSDEEREADAAMLGFTVVAEMDEWGNMAIKVMTDGFKTNAINLAKVTHDIHIKMNLLRGKYKGLVPWSNWKNNDQHFRHMLPSFRSEAPVYMQIQAGQTGKKGQDYRASDEWKGMIPDNLRNSTIARIYAFAKPIIAEWFKGVTEDNLPLIDQIHTFGLSHFTNWAAEVSPYALDLAFQLMIEYGALHQVIFQKSEKVTTDEVKKQGKSTVPGKPVDSEILEDFGDSWRNLLAKWEGKFSSRTEMVNALWRASHYSRGRAADAAAVFIAFPEECLDIIRRKPGKRGVGEPIRCLMIGLPYAFYIPPDHLDGVPITITTMKVMGTYQKVVISEDPELNRKLTDQTAKGFPRYTMGVVPEPERGHEKSGMSYPDDGRYLANLQKQADRSRWNAWLEPVVPPPTEEPEE